MGLPVDGGDRWEDEPEALAWGVEGMDFVDNEGLPETEGGESAIELDKEEGDEEVMPRKYHRFRLTLRESLMTLGYHGTRL